MDEPYKTQSLEIEAEVARHGFRTAVSGISVMLCSMDDTVYGTHIFIEQNQGSAGITIARFSARVLQTRHGRKRRLAPFLSMIRPTLTR